MASRQTAASKLLATRGRKIAAAIGAAFLASIGAGIAARTLNSAESVTKKALAGSSAPLEIRVAAPGTFEAGTPIGQYYVTPKSEMSSPTALDSAELSGNDPFNFAFARNHSGVEGSPQIVRLQLRAKGDEPVTINAITVHVVRRAAPIQGWYAISAGCGGLTVRTASVNLDAPKPEVQLLDDLGAPKKDIALFVTRTDIELIELQASTEKAMVDWTAEVFYSGPKGDGSVTVDDGGHPFRVTTETASDGYELNFGPGPKVKRQHKWDENGISVC
jgi:hypothetical protein